MNEWILFLILLLAPIMSSIPIALAYKSKAWVDRLPYLSVLGIFASVIVSGYLLFGPFEGQFAYPWIPDLGINFVFITDYLSKHMGFITALIAFFIAIYGVDYMRGDYRLPWYWFFFNLFTASMLLVVYSDNLFLLFVGWEGLGVASWGLIGHWYRDDDEISYVGTMERKVGPLNFSWPPSVGGWRAISTIRFGDVPMFFAIAAIWLFAGSLNISEIDWGKLFGTVGSAGTTIILLLFLIGLFTKSAQVPFSEWLMTAMTGPTTVSALLHSATMVAAGAYVFMRITWYIQPWTLQGVPGLEVVYVIALFIGLLSGLYGALCALGMLERKVLLAATTMSSLGLMFGATAASYWLDITVHEGINLAVLVGFWYLATHAFAKATLFLVSGHLIHATHSRFSVGDLELGKKMKAGFGATLIATTFLVGIPPLTAYWVKSSMDVVMEHLMLIYSIVPLILLLATSITYSAVLARFTSTNFIKGERPHVTHLEGGGLMKAGYLMMVAVLFVIFYLIFTRSELAEFVHAGLEPLSLAVGILVLASYSIAIFKPRLPSLQKLATFLSDRMYFPYLNDYLCPKIGFFFSQIFDQYVNRGLDGFYNTKVIPNLFGSISKGIRAIQTGYMQTYVRIVLSLVMVFLLIASIAVGVMLL